MQLIPWSQPVATVYGSLMQHRTELEALGDAAHQAPYNAPPQAPVLYIKPANTFSAIDASVSMPVGAKQLRTRVCMGLFFKQNWHLASADTAQTAIDLIAKDRVAVSLLCDLTLPHNSFHRPPVKFNAFDGSLGLPAQAIEASALDLSNLVIETWVNAAMQHSYRSADWLHSAAQQLQRVGQFISFEAGDVLMMGCPPDAPLVQAGDVVEARMSGHTFTRNRITGATT